MIIFRPSVLARLDGFSYAGKRAENSINSGIGKVQSRVCSKAKARHRPGFKGYLQFESKGDCGPYYSPFASADIF